MTDSIEGFGLAAPELPEVRILRLQPGDVLLFTSQRRLADQEFEELREHLKSGPLSGYQCAVLDGGMTLDVLRKEEAVPGE